MIDDRFVLLHHVGDELELLEGSEFKAIAPRRRHLGVDVGTGSDEINRVGLEVLNEVDLALGRPDHLEGAGFPLLLDLYLELLKPEMEVDGERRRLGILLV